MKKNVLIISSTPRKGGNSETLAEEFAKGARNSGNNVEIITLHDKKINFCRGCFGCHDAHKCVINDDAVEIADKMFSADVLVFATPVYYYSVCGQLKTMLDRGNPLFDSDYAFTDVYLLATAADSEKAAVTGAVTAIQGWVDCFDRARLAGVIFAGGVNGVGEIRGHKALAEARAAGEKV